MDDGGAVIADPGACGTQPDPSGRERGTELLPSPGFQTRIGGRARIGDHGGHEPVLLYIKPWHCGNGDLRELHVRGTYACR